MIKKSASPHPQWAVIYRKPGTELRNIKGKYYLYEVRSRYDATSKKTKKVTGKLLGRITEDDGFLESGIRTLQRKASQPIDLSTICVKEWGVSCFMEQHNAAIKKSLQEYFPQYWQMIRAIAYCRLVHHSPIKNMAFHLHKSLLGEEVLSISDKKISLLLRDIGRDREQVSAFMRSFIKGGDHVMVDMTQVFSASNQISLAKEGYNSDLVFDRQFNLMYIYSPKLMQPVFYRLYAGNIREVKGFKICMEESGIKNAVVIADKGFYSAQNLEMLEQQQLDYIIPLRRDNKLIDYTKNIQQATQYFKHEDRYIWYCDYKIEKHHIFLYKDEKLQVQEQQDYLDRIETLPEEYNINSFHQNKQRFGTIAMITNLAGNLDAAELYTTYKSRNEIEVMFDGMKNILDADKTYMQNEEALQGWMFINHIALMCYYSLYQLLKSNNMLKKYSVNDLIIHLKEIKKVRINNIWQLEPITSATQKLLEKLNVSVT